MTTDEALAEKLSGVDPKIKEYVECSVVLLEEYVSTEDILAGFDSLVQLCQEEFK